jgi:hypothetical protein
MDDLGRSFIALGSSYRLSEVAAISWNPLHCFPQFHTVPHFHERWQSPLSGEACTYLKLREIVFTLRLVLSY